MMRDVGALALMSCSIIGALGLIVARRSLPQSPLGLTLLAVLVAMLITHLTSIDRRYSAWMIILWTGFIAVHYVTLQLPQRTVRAGLRAVGWILAAQVLIEVAITQSRARYLAGNPNVLAAWLLPLLFTAPVTGAWSVASALATLATGSRGALLGVSVAFCAQKPISPWLLLVGGLLGAVLLAFARPSTTMNRLGTWTEAADLALERPVTGWGPRTYTELARNEPHHPHADNLMLTVAAEQGIVGLAAWAWLAASVAVLVRRSTAPARWSILAVAVHQMVDCTLFWPWAGILTMAALALVVRGDHGPA
jgi:O-antigen ligase